MTVKDIKAILDENEIAYEDGMLKADLEALLPEEEEVEEEVEDVEESTDEVEEEEPVEEEVEESKAGEYAVYAKNGDYIRTYSNDRHGKDAKKLAEGFAKKVKGKVK